MMKMLGIKKEGGESWDDYHNRRRSELAFWRRMLRVLPWSRVVAVGHWRWIGHLARMEPTRPARMALEHEGKDLHATTRRVGGHQSHQRARA